MKHHLTTKLLILSILLFSPVILSAQSLPLGSTCFRTAECGKDSAGVDLGCRVSNLGDYNVCKIVSAGAIGCEQSPFGENYCGDNLVCFKNTCTYDYLVPRDQPLPFLGREIGLRCDRTADCGKDSNHIDLGCRWSNIGEYKICKIVSTGALGCNQAPSGENYCGDDLICKNNKCYYDWEQPQDIKLDFFGKIIAQIKFYLTLENFKRILPLFINLILSIALIVGCVLFLKGYMKRQYCQDYEKDLHKGINYMTAGGIIAGAAVLLGIILPIIWSRIL